MVELKFCKFCWENEEESPNTLCQPCKCLGTNQNVHNSCLRDWIKVSGDSECKFCLAPYNIEFKKVVKGFCFWMCSTNDLLTKGFTTLIMLFVISSNVFFLPGSISKLPSVNFDSKSNDFYIAPIITLVIGIISSIFLVILLIIHVRRTYVRWTRSNFTIEFAQMT